MHRKRRRRIEFLDFVNDIGAAYLGQELHVVIDKRIRKGGRDILKTN